MLLFCRLTLKPHILDGLHTLDTLRILSTSRITPLSLTPWIRTHVTSRGVFYCLSFDIIPIYFYIIWPVFSQCFIDSLYTTSWHPVILIYITNLVSIHQVATYFQSTLKTYSEHTYNILLTAPSPLTIDMHIIIRNYRCILTLQSWYILITYPRHTLPYRHPLAHYLQYIFIFCLTYPSLLYTPACLRHSTNNPHYMCMYTHSKALTPFYCSIYMMTVVHQHLVRYYSPVLRLKNIIYNSSFTLTFKNPNFISNFIIYNVYWYSHLLTRIDNHNSR